MTDSPVPSDDPATTAILDFQAVMAQWLDLQAAMARMQTEGSPRTGVQTSTGERGSAARVFEQAAHPPTAAATISPNDPPRAQTVDAVASARPSEPTWSRYSVVIQPCPRNEGHALLAAGHAVVMTDDGQGVADAVADRLRREGVRVALVSLSDRGRSMPDVFDSAIDSAAEAARLVASVVASVGQVGALIHLAPLAPTPPFSTLDSSSWWGQLARETRALFLLSQALSGSLHDAARHGGAACLAATRMGGAHGSTHVGDNPLPSQGGVAGFLKCLAIEWPDVRVRAIDLDDRATVEALASQVVDELWAIETRVEIGYRDGQRVTLDVAREPAVVDPTFDLPSDSVILATGGARGITADVCLELAERYQPTFVLVGQSPLPPASEGPDTAGVATPSELKRILTATLQQQGGRVTPAVVERAYRTLMKEREIRDTLSRLSAAGARTHYVQLDVQDEQALGALIDEIYATYGRLDGVIHGAGVIEDKLVRDKTLESFDRVLSTKVLSAFALSRRVRPETLRFLVFFTSVAGRFGNQGQADYAAANEVVSKLAVALQAQWPGRVCAIAWAPWDKRGMVSAELKREFARRGVTLLSPTAGRRALWQEIQQGARSPAEVVIGGEGSPSLAGESHRASAPLLIGATRADHPDYVCFERTIDPAVHSYLNDHRLDGRPVLPLAFATELMAEAAQAVSPTLTVVGVRGLQLFKGIVVDREPVPVRVSVGAAVRRHGEGVSEVDVEIATPHTTPAPRYRCVVQLAPSRGTPPPFTAPTWALVPLSTPLAVAYREWTFHGPLFQRITELSGIGPGAILGSVFSPSAISGVANVFGADWIIDPFVFDAALQMLLIWSRDQNGKTALPSRFRAFRRYAGLSDQPLTCYVAVESLAGGHALRSTVHFVDASGHVRGVLEEMEANCTEALNRLAVASAGDGRVS